MTVERNLDLTWKIPSLVAGASTEVLHNDLATLEEQEKKEHLVGMDKFWGEYVAAVRQEITRRNGAASQTEGNNYRFGIEHCVIEARRSVSAGAVRSRLGKLGGSLQVGIDDRLNKGEIYNFHIHTDDPKSVLNYLRWLGRIQDEVVIEDNLEKAENANLSCSTGV